MPDQTLVKILLAGSLLWLVSASAGLASVASPRGEVPTDSPSDPHRRRRVILEAIGQSANVAAALTLLVGTWRQLDAKFDAFLPVLLGVGSAVAVGVVYFLTAGLNWIARASIIGAVVTALAVAGILIASTYGVLTPA